MTENISDGGARQEIEDELPYGMERRLVLRLLTHWRAICGERDYSSFAEVDPAAMPNMWGSCFALEVIGHEEDPFF